MENLKGFTYLKMWKELQFWQKTNKQTNKQQFGT